ncbi:sigma-70 family RNA polymerase sigma factor [Xylophilus sp.]|uniref:sigma-70 family RNA polymerase sigma factor n=1 Tax=Xylophilus sp. TaxID=2653893 RepID=UPI0013B730AD|nr:sigma-70 family RNA polymerase sigma factor [Xylophilus sp.]KAF1049571.1 MAG: putative RNA polymerase sigma factor FecI [Xylophilus sp.]
MHADLYTEHHGWIESWLRRQIGCAWAAQDLSHDTFVQVLKAPRLEPGELREPRAFLVTVARRVLYNHRRRRDLELAWLEALAAFGDALAPSAEERAAVLEALARLDAVLQALPAHARQVFVLSQVDGLSYPCIGKELGLSAVTVRRAMKQALAALVAAF